MIHEEPEVQSIQTIDPLELLGDDPTSQDAEGPEIREEISTRWSSFAREGISNEDRTQLLANYPITKNCKALRAPELNGEIKAILKNNTRQDTFLAKLQSQLGAGISAMAGPINEMYSKPTEESNQWLKKLIDASKIIIDVHHALSTHRRYLAGPAINPEIKNIIEESPIEDALFGNDFTERIKASNEIKKNSTELKLAKPKTFKKVKPTTPNLNARRPSSMPYHPTYGEKRYKGHYKSHERKFTSKQGRKAQQKRTYY